MAEIILLILLIHVVICLIIIDYKSWSEDRRRVDNE